SGLRYLAPALVLGLALLPAAVARLSLLDHGLRRDNHTEGWRRSLRVAAIVVGYPVERHYLANRYEDPSFTTPGLNAAFAWARDVSGARIATTSTRQYPLFGTDLSNHVSYVGIE